VNVVSNSVFSIVAGKVASQRWLAGWKMELYNLIDGAAAGGGIQTILSLSGDQLTFVAPFSITPTTAMGVKFTDYATATGPQKKSVFITDGTNNFPSDNGKPYRIMFG
jgi:hypothetical protein